MKKAIVCFIVSIVLISCVQITGEKGSLTKENVENYIKAYKSIREVAPGILKDINSNNNESKSGKSGFKEIENIILDSGLKSYAEFVQLNAKIGTVFSMLQATKGMDAQKNLQDSGQDMFDDSRRFIEEQLNDPEIPIETKSELRKTLEEIDKNSKELKDNYESNKFIADWVLDKTKMLQGLIVNEADIEIIQAYEEEIFEVYTGFPRPKGFEGNLPDLDTILW